MQTLTTRARRAPLAMALFVALLAPGLAFAQTAKERELEARIARKGIAFGPACELQGSADGTSRREALECRPQSVGTREGGTANGEMDTRPTSAPGKGRCPVEMRAAGRVAPDDTLREDRAPRVHGSLRGMR